MFTLISKKYCFVKKLLKLPITFSRLHAEGFSMENSIDKIPFVGKHQFTQLPVYRILNSSKMDHVTIDKLQFHEDLLVDIYKTMLSLSVMDTILYECQRQGRISFYMTNIGEEAVQIGSAAALLPDDLVYAQYRESGVLLWRGLDYTFFVNQCFGNKSDKSKGRQMPVHYGCKSLNFVTISSPLGTQLPQAVGAAYGLKNHHKDQCVTCYFGEGAASEGDAHAALNFAAVLECPILLICRNNGYAISTPASQQYKGHGIAVRGPAYGIRTIRVDGNDALAMYQVTKEARQYVVREKKPVLIEAITYRIGHHSTSDDSTAYRKFGDIADYSRNCPIVRLKKFLCDSMIWDDKKEQEWLIKSRNHIINAICFAEIEEKPLLKDLFSDVYYTWPRNLTTMIRISQSEIEVNILLFVQVLEL
ncbi:2-oxoisovalerate dehydrogenase subunit alpha, mitochondrial [Copidosoma floridanum]|uniref:2-oxoisovalerate dehydrogenase subunit alpha, mitochondrial n=1 Tax=Copidosoma floridanum TaxID=29053 RepID=UPI0006C9484F|nr:2-oxoisovalerate dehydrogenase subunit alpha, mitochondrial [Copidosoma floridanum]